MELWFNRHIFGIQVIRFGHCDCDQDYCLTCEVKFRFSHWFKRVIG